MMLDILILMYNKIFNDQFLNHFMYMQAEKIDNNIVVCSKDYIFIEQNTENNLWWYE